MSGRTVRAVVSILRQEAPPKYKPGLVMSSTVIAKKSPWAVSLASVCAIAVAIGFTVSSVHAGFDVTSRPWMAKRLWTWVAVAYIACPMLVVFVLTHFANLARRGFVCIAVEGDCLTVTALSTKSVPISALKAIEVKRGLLLLTLESGKQIDVGCFGLIGGVEAVIERLMQLKPGLLRSGPF